MNRIPSSTPGQTLIGDPDAPKEPPVLISGSAIEIVYRRTRELITNSPTPELPDSGGGITWTWDAVRVLLSIMPDVKDRNDTRICHYLVQLKRKGFFDIEGDGMITLPKGAHQ